MSNNEGPRFSVIPKRSIEVYAESIGILGRSIGDDVTENLSEDATYRVREALQNAIRFMKHSKRRHLTVEDFNKGLKWANVEQVYGHGGMELAHFKSLSPKDTNLQVFYIEGKEINLRELSLDLSLPPDSGDVGVRAQWLVFEGITCLGGKLGKEEISWAKERLDEPYLQYLETLVAAIFGKYKTAQQKALQSLRELPQLQVVLPNLISFLAVKVKAANGNHELHIIAEETLCIIKALVENTSLFLNPYVLQLVKLLLFVIMEGNLNVRHWHFKKIAASIVATICRRHMATMQHLPHQLLKAFQDCCLDTTRSVESVYGAVVGLISLGAEAVFQVLCPNMRAKIDLVMDAMSEHDTQDPDQCFGAVMLYGALKDAGACLLKKYAANANSKTYSSGGSAQPPRKLCSLYSDFTQEFGEAMVVECLTCANVSNGRGSLQQNRALKLGMMNRDSDSSRNMIQTYFDSIKSKVCDRVDTKVEISQHRFDRKEFASQTSQGELHGHLFRKRPIIVGTSVQDWFDDQPIYQSSKRPKLELDKPRQFKLDSKKVPSVSKSKQMLLYDISRISLALDMPL